MNKLTIIVQTYNREDGLKSCLESLEQQKDKNFEILIYSNGAEYDCKEIAIKTLLTKKYKIINKKSNKGLVYGRNDSVKYVETEYFSRVDDDDIALDFYVQKVNALLETKYDAIFLSDKKADYLPTAPYRYIIKKIEFIEYPNIIPEDGFSQYYYYSKASMPYIMIENIMNIKSGGFIQRHDFEINFVAIEYWYNKIDLTAKSEINFPKIASLVASTTIINNILREVYDLSKEKEEVKELRRKYRELKKSHFFSKYPIKIKHRLIWSILYRFFTFKWLKL